MAKLKQNIKKLAQKASLSPQRIKKPTITKIPAKGGFGGSIVKQDDPIGTATVMCGALNVRNGAGTNYPRIGGLTYGKVVNVYEEKDGWIRIGYGTDYGWVCAKYTSYQSGGSITTEPTTPTPEPEPEPGPTPEPEPEPTPEPEPEPEPEPPSSTSFQVRVTPWDGLNVRTGPGTGYGIITALPQGTVVTVTDEQDGWYKIEYNGIVGWVCAEYTEKVGGSVTPPGPSTDPTTPTTPTTPTGTGQAAADLAATYEGWRTKDLLGTLPYLQDLSGISGTNNGYDLNCANFTSAILQQVGLLSSHSNMVSGVRSNCLSEGYHASNKANAKPGDIWLNGDQHAEIVYSNSGGTVTLIGSNNKGGGDVQYVTKDSWSPNNYPYADYYSCQ